MRNILLSQGALSPLARMMLPNKGSTVRTAAWALSNLIKVLIASYTENEHVVENYNFVFGFMKTLLALLD